MFPTPKVCYVALSLIATASVGVAQSHTVRVSGEQQAAWLQATLNELVVRLDNCRGTRASVEFGRLLGDRRFEFDIPVHRLGVFAGANQRFAIYDRERQGVEQIFKFGEGWGDSYETTAVGTGNLDADPADEFVIARAGEGVAHLYVFDDESTGFELLCKHPKSNWSESRFVTSLALGDVDGDGRDEIVFGRNGGSTKAMRLGVLDDASGNFRRLNDGLRSDGKRQDLSYWGGEHGVGVVRCGNLDADRRDEIVLLARDVIYVLDDARAKFDHIEKLDRSGRARFLALGDVDGDGRDEIVHSRDVAKNRRLYVLDDFVGCFELLNGGRAPNGNWQDFSHWGDGHRIGEDLSQPSAFARASSPLACGDVDGDGRDEIVMIARGKLYVVDDHRARYALLQTYRPRSWGRSMRPVAVVTGDVDGDGRDEILFGRTPTSGKKSMKFRVLDDHAAGYQVLNPGRPAEGSGWGGSRFARSLALGDVDGDGRDELLIGRNRDRAGLAEGVVGEAFLYLNDVRSQRPRFVDKPTVLTASIAFETEGPELCVRGRGLTKSVMPRDAERIGLEVDFKLEANGGSTELRVQDVRLDLFVPQLGLAMGFETILESVIERNVKAALERHSRTVSLDIDRTLRGWVASQVPAPLRPLALRDDGISITSRPGSTELVVTVGRSGD